MFVGTYLNLRFKAVQSGLEWAMIFFIFQIKSIKIEKQNALLGWRNSILKRKKVYISNGKTAYFKIDLTALDFIGFAAIQCIVYAEY